jgi:hypothetical protein
MKAKTRKELLFSKVVLVVLALVGLLVVVWVAWGLPDNKEADINSFEECAAAGHPIQDSYPEVCAVPGADGQRFVNPDQKVEVPY